MDMNTKEITKNMTQDEMAYERTEMSSERTAMAEERTAMAIERTVMAFERTSLTNSQTLLAYTRTAIALLAAGVGMFEFVDNRAIITLGVLIMLLAPVVEAIGIIHFFMVRRRLKRILTPERTAQTPPEDAGASENDSDPDTP